IPRESNAGGNVILVRIKDVLWKSQGTWAITNRIDRGSVESSDVIPSLLGNCGVQLIAHTQVDCKIRTHLPIILDVGGNPPSCITTQPDAQNARVIHPIQQERSEGIAAVSRGTWISRCS